MSPPMGPVYYAFMCRLCGEGYFSNPQILPDTTQAWASGPDAWEGLEEPASAYNIIKMKEGQKFGNPYKAITT